MRRTGEERSSRKGGWIHRVATAGGGTTHRRRLLSELLRLLDRLLRRRRLGERSDRCLLRDFFFSWLRLRDRLRRPPSRSLSRPLPRGSAARVAGAPSAPAGAEAGFTALPSAPPGGGGGGLSSSIGAAAVATGWSAASVMRRVADVATRKMCVAAWAATPTQNAPVQWVSRRRTHARLSARQFVVHGGVCESQDGWLCSRVAAG